MATPTLFVPIDVRFPDEDNVIEAGLDGAGLYVMACCRAKSLLSDGRLTRTQLYRLGASHALIDHLIKVGLFTRDADDAVRITAWPKHHAPASEVLDSTKGAELAHQRWHENKGIKNPDCAHCFPPNPQVDAKKCDADTDTQCDTYAACGMPESESESESDNPSSSQSDLQPDPDERTEDRGKPADRQARAAAACELIGNRNHLAALDRGEVRNRDRHQAACRNGARADHLEAAQRLAHQHPDWTPDRIANELTRTTVPLEESQHPAVLNDTQRRAHDAQLAAQPETDDHASRAAEARAALAAAQQPTDPGAAA